MMTTLSAWVQLMADDLLHVVVPPTVEDRRVSEVVIHDPLDHLSTVRDALIIVTGIDCGTAEFGHMVARVADGDAVGVIVKARGTPVEHLRAVSDASGVCFAVVRDDADWTRVAAIARSAVAGAEVDSVSGVRLGDLFAFADAVAAMTSGATSFVDPTGHVIGYSTIPGQPIDTVRRESTLTLREPTMPAMDSDYQLLYARDTAIVIQPTGFELGRLAIAVRAGGELLGSMWVIDPGEDRRPTALDALNRVAPLAGLHMLHARSASDFTERRNADLIRTVLDDAVHARSAAAQLGLDAQYSRGLAVAAFTVADPHAGGVDAVRGLHRLRQLVTVTCTLQFGSAYTALIDSIVFAILPGTDTSARSAHRRLVSDIGGYTTSIGAHPVVAVVGGAVGGLDGIGRSRTDAVRTVDHLLRRVRTASPGSHPPVTGLHEDHAIELGLLEIGDYIADHDLGRFDVVDAIRRHDAEHSTDLLPTLRAYLDAGGNVSRAAHELHVHGNTVRYRIAAVSTDFDIDLDDPTTRLWLWLRLASQRR